MDAVNIHGIKLHSFTLSELDNVIDNCIKNTELNIFYGQAFATIEFYKKNPYLYKIINSFDLLVCDGTIFYWYIKILGYRIKTFMSIPDLTNYILEYANNHNLSVILFGATKETNNIATLNLQKKYINVKFYNGINGYYNKKNEYKIIKKLNYLKPDILLIGISSPYKEKFAYKYKDILNIKIIIPCGGMIDVYSGKVKLTPKWMKRIGLAFLYRLIQEPKRFIKYFYFTIIDTFFIIIPLSLIFKFVLRKNLFNIVEIYLKIYHKNINSKIK